MALRILSSPSDADGASRVADELRASIERALPGAGVEVRPTSPGHFEIAVVSDVFAERSRVKQQQLVYGAIAHLMKGEVPPVHAVDRLVTRLPDA
jgi:acid stress-induced BolA-like protein IbaG/YrbA